MLRGSPHAELVLSFECPTLEASELVRIVLSMEQLHDRVLRAVRRLSCTAEVPAEDRLKVAAVRISGVAEIRFVGALLDPSRPMGSGTGVLEVVRELLGGGLAGQAERLAKHLGSEPVGAGGGGVALAAAARDFREELARRAKVLLPGASKEDIEEIAELAYRIPGEVFRKKNLRGLTVG